MDSIGEIVRSGRELALQHKVDALEAEVDRLLALLLVARRERLPTDRGGVVMKIKVGQAKVYLKTGEYSDGRLGEIFLQLDECGPVNGAANAHVEVLAAISGLDEERRKAILDAIARREFTISALTEQVTDFSVSISRLLDALATAVSIGLQCQIPLEVFCNKFEHTNFEPSDRMGVAGQPRVSSPLDAAFRYLRTRYVAATVEAEEEGSVVADGNSQAGG